MVVYRSKGNARVCNNTASKREEERKKERERNNERVVVDVP